MIVNWMGVVDVIRMAQNGPPLLNTSAISFPPKTDPYAAVGTFQITFVTSFNDRSLSDILFCNRVIIYCAYVLFHNTKPLYM